MTVQALSMAVWDTDPPRGTMLKQRLDMFGGREAVLYAGQWDGDVKYDVFFLCFDKPGEPVLKAARLTRQAGESTFLLLVIDRGCDVIPFMRPQIRPSGVIFRPVKNLQLRETLDEVVSEMERLAGENSDEVYTVSADGVTYRINLNDVLFFEALNKKIYLHTPGQEIGYYGSIETIAGDLPGYFVRCHRSFLVNIKKADALNRTDMTLNLTGGYSIPVSRSRRDAVLEKIHLTASSRRA